MKIHRQKVHTKRLYFQNLVIQLFWRHLCWSRLLEQAQVVEFSTAASSSVSSFEQKECNLVAGIMHLQGQTVKRIFSKDNIEILDHKILRVGNQVTRDGLPGVSEGSRQPGLAVAQGKQIILSI